MRKIETQKKFDGVSKQMDKLLKVGPERKEEVSQEFKKSPGKEWKKMTLKY